ncbi:hypothetical protein HYW17_05210 [Candidatus Uhrbacteria bacterium]|nr:hypothetical protein [Candidatus Uhrbacteria bacterium]
MKIIEQSITKAELAELAKERFGDMVKAVVDLARGIMAVGGSMHADEEQLLLESGSMQENLWGINIYPEQDKDAWIEFDSMINLRPWQGNRSRGVESEAIRTQIKAAVDKLVTP